MEMNWEVRIQKLAILLVVGTERKKVEKKNGLGSENIVIVWTGVVDT